MRLAPVWQTKAKPISRPKGVTDLMTGGNLTKGDLTEGNNIQSAIIHYQLLMRIKSWMFA